MGLFPGVCLRNRKPHHIEKTTNLRKDYICRGEAKTFGWGIHQHRGSPLSEGYRLQEDACRAGPGEGEAGGGWFGGCGWPSCALGTLEGHDWMPWAPVTL